MLIKEYFKLVRELDEDRLEKAIILALNPSLEMINYYAKYVRGFNESLPPQPSIESISIESIKKILGEDGVEIFLAVDQVISLMPRYMLRRLNEALTKNEDLDIVRTLSRKLYDEYSKTVDGVRVEDLIFEDYRKESILLVLPSWRQLELVHGRWRELAWREKTLKNEETPTVEGWIKDVTLLADVLVDEGVKSIIVADTVHEGRLPVSGGEVIYVDFGRGLCKIGYPRDSSISWLNRPIISNMALPFRRGEEEIITEVYWKIGLTPILRLRWVESDGSLKRVKVEGGNFFMVGDDEEAALITGIGVRGTDPETFTLLDSLLPKRVRFFGVPLSGYLKDWVSGVVHLDVVFAYLGEVGEGRVALVDPSRMGFYSILEYDRDSKNFKVKSFIEFAREFELTIDEPPRRLGSPITMINALNLGNGKLVVDSFNREVNRYLEKELKVDLIEVDIPHIEAGGGGPRCATRDIPSLRSSS
ncbi:MAG: hypothetical protein QXF28_02475 [Nitrososphaerota archaeon]